MGYGFGVMGYVFWVLGSEVLFKSEYPSAMHSVLSWCNH